MPEVATSDDTAQRTAILSALAILDELGGHSFKQEMLALFLFESPRQMAELSSAVDRGDIRTAKRLAHTLKSTASVFGVQALGALALRVEKELSIIGTVEASQLLKTMESEYGRCAEIIREM